MLREIDGMCDLRAVV